MSRKALESASALIIGNEILNASIQDTNSHYFAKYCYDMGIDLKKVEVVPDIKEDIKEAVLRHSKKYDLVITSGGIGSTIDDITYATIGEAFNLPLYQHQATIDRMFKFKPDTYKPSVRELLLLMATFPMRKDQNQNEVVEKFDLCRPETQSEVAPTQVFYPMEDSFVPIVCVNRNIMIFPGVPHLFKLMLQGVKPQLLQLVDASRKRTTEHINIKELEANVMDTIKDVWNKAESIKDVSVGSYPRKEDTGDRYTQIRISGPVAQKETISGFINEIRELFRDVILDSNLH